MKTTLIFLSLLLGGIKSTHYSYAPAGKYTVKSSAISAKLPSGMAQVKFELKFKSACEPNEIKLAVDGLNAGKTATVKNPRMNTMVKKGKHVFRLIAANCDTLVTETLDLKEKTSTTIEVEF